MSYEQLIEAINSLNANITGLRGEVRARTDSFRKLLKWLAWMAAAMFFFIIILTINAGYGRFVSTRIQSATDPNGKLYKEGQEEGDCRHRRAVANLPAPPSDKSCKDVTPREVYPGG